MSVSRLEPSFFKEFIDSFFSPFPTEEFRRLSDFALLAFGVHCAEEQAVFPRSIESWAGVREVFSVAFFLWIFAYFTSFSSFGVVGGFSAATLSTT